jgi:transcriptional regulator with XRE-family HTH domain
MPLDIRIRFGRAIRRIRKEQKIVQEEAAERCGLHRTYYSGIERGVRNVLLVNIDKVAKGLKRLCRNCSAVSDSAPLSSQTGIKGTATQIQIAGAKVPAFKLRLEIEPRS